MEFAIVLFYCYVYVSIIPRVSIVAFAIVLFLLLPFSSTLMFFFLLFFSIEMSTAYIFGFHFQIPFIDASRVDEVTAAETKAKT